MGIIQEQIETKKVMLNISVELAELYEKNKKLAKELKLKLDFDSEFEKWFRRQNEKISTELDARKEQKPQKTKK